MYHVESPCNRKAMERWRGRTALVTGAADGIGAAVAVKLAYHGMKVIGCGGNVKKILVSFNLSLKKFKLR